MGTLKGKMTMSMDISKGKRAWRNKAFRTDMDLWTKTFVQKEKTVFVQPPIPIVPLPVLTAAVLDDPAMLFCTLCAHTVPHGHEREYYGAMLASLGFVMDEWGNWFLQIGESTTAFMSHLDTADSHVAAVNMQEVEGIVSTDGTSILGADDRAGVTVLLSLARRGVPGLYCLFVGEERGCIGSGASVQHNTERYAGIQRAVSFDRRGTSSVITHQSMVRCCSQAFATALCDALGEHGMPYAPDDTGSFTDSREFVSLVPECTNLSVGYEHAHCNTEQQNVRFLAFLVDAACRIDWEALPVARDPLAVEDEWAGYWENYGDVRETRLRGRAYSAKEVDAAWARLESGIETGDELDVYDIACCVREDPEYAAMLLEEYADTHGRYDTGLEL